MGAAICEKMTAYVSPNDVIIVPVPLHPKKLRKRGYNQASLIADSISLACQDSGCKTYEFHNDILERIVDTRSQAGLHKKERQINVKNAFLVKFEAKISGRHVVLVDDVFTTGATVSECAKALKKAGASGVSVFTFARVRDS